MARRQAEPDGCVTIQIGDHVLSTNGKQVLACYDTKTGAITRRETVME